MRDETDKPPLTGETIVPKTHSEVRRDYLIRYWTYQNTVVAARAALHKAALETGRNSPFPPNGTIYTASNGQK